jgi:hypothetical protein
MKTHNSDAGPEVDEAPPNLMGYASTLGMVVVRKVSLTTRSISILSSSGDSQKMRLMRLLHERWYPGLA